MAIDNYICVASIIPGTEYKSTGPAGSAGPLPLGPLPKSFFMERDKVAQPLTLHSNTKTAPNLVLIQMPSSFVLHPSAYDSFAFGARKAIMTQLVWLWFAFPFKPRLHPLLVVCLT